VEAGGQGFVPGFGGMPIRAFPGVFSSVLIVLDVRWAWVGSFVWLLEFECGLVPFPRWGSRLRWPPLEGCFSVVAVASRLPFLKFQEFLTRRPVACASGVVGCVDRKSRGGDVGCSPRRLRVLLTYSRGRNSALASWVVEMVAVRAFLDQLTVYGIDGEFLRRGSRWCVLGGGFASRFFPSLNCSGS